MNNRLDACLIKLVQLLFVGILARLMDYTKQLNSISNYYIQFDFSCNLWGDLIFYHSLIYIIISQPRHEMMRRSDRAIRPPSYFGFRDHSEENPNEDSVFASQRVSDDEQEDPYNETEDKIENEEQHTGATQQLRVMSLSEQDHYPVVPITENVTNCNERSLPIEPKRMFRTTSSIQPINLTARSNDKNHT